MSADDDEADLFANGAKILNHRRAITSGQERSEVDGRYAVHDAILLCGGDHIGSAWLWFASTIRSNGKSWSINPPERSAAFSRTKLATGSAGVLAHSKASR